MAGGEEEPRLHRLGEREAKQWLPQLLHNVSLASAAGDASFRSSIASATATDASFPSYVASMADTESEDDAEMGRRMHSEVEEIPSFRWMPSPLRRCRRRSASQGEGKRKDGTLGSPSSIGEDVHGPSLFSFRTRKGSLGTLHKKRLKDGTQVAMMRLVQIARGFQAEVDQLGMVRHPNLLVLRAHYSWQDDKLLVFDHVPKGNLSAFLHDRGTDNPIDWGTRLNMAVGITWGLHYLHTREKMVHGNLTSRNILLDHDPDDAKVAKYYPYCLMTNATNSTTIATAGSGASWYHAPELSMLKEANTKTDVYSLGVILLELWTGKSPGEAMGSVDLPQWVTSIINEGGKLEVFDQELRGRRVEDLFYSLNVALHCVNPSPDARPEVEQVLHQLSEINAHLSWGKRSRNVSIQ